MLFGARSADAATVRAILVGGSGCAGGYYDVEYRAVWGERNNLTVAEVPGVPFLVPCLEPTGDVLAFADAGASIQAKGSFCRSGGNVAACLAPSSAPVVFAGDRADSIRIGPNLSGAIVYGGPGNDQVVTVNGPTDSVTCGEGADTVRADRKDTVSSDCETVTRI